MPQYSFRCLKCLQKTVVTHSVNEPHPTTCKCGGELVRLFDKPNVVYRGSGFYTTDKALYESGEDDE